LRVVVGVDVDEPGRDDLPGGVEHAGAVEPRTDLADPTVRDGHVGSLAR